MNASPQARARHDTFDVGRSGPRTLLSALDDGRTAVQQEARRTRGRFLRRTLSLGHSTSSAPSSGRMPQLGQLRAGHGYPRHRYRHACDQGPACSAPCTRPTKHNRRLVGRRDQLKASSGGGKAARKACSSVRAEDFGADGHSHARNYDHDRPCDKPSYRCRKLGSLLDVEFRWDCMVKVWEDPHAALARTEPEPNPPKASDKRLAEADVVGPAVRPVEALLTSSVFLLAFEPMSMAWGERSGLAGELTGDAPATTPTPSRSHPSDCRTPANLRTVSRRSRRIRPSCFPGRP